MLDKLIEFLSSFADKLQPFVVIPHYDRGVRLRYGKLVGGVLEPGFHWKYPFSDEILTHMVKTTTLNLPEQSLTTADDKSIVIRVAVKYEIVDVVQLLLEVNSPVDALSDMVCGIVREKIINRTWKQCCDDKLISDISRSAKVEAKRWGIEITAVTITDLGIIRSIRLIKTEDIKL